MNLTPFENRSTTVAQMCRSRKELSNDVSIFVFIKMNENTLIFGKASFLPFLGGSWVRTRKSRWSRVGTLTGGNFEDYIRFVSYYLFGPVKHEQNWKGWERSGEKA
jgi:hypothetical protein